MANPELLASLLSNSPLPWEILCIPSVDSTNGELSRRFSNSLSVPRLVLWAEEQTVGRGRLNRSWLSVPGRDITASVCFPSPVRPADSPKLSLVAAISLVHVLEKTLRLQTQMRWPNDIVTPRGKLAGILSVYLSNSHGIVCGIGINVNSKPGDVRLERERPRTTLLSELGCEVDRERLLAAWLGEFERNWLLASEDRIDALRTEFDRVSFYAGKRVKVLVGAGDSRDSQPGGSELAGTAASIDRNGALIVEIPGQPPYAVSVEDVLIPTED
jgi:BirA family biotin operon repressor/biotin-[acetyl-CoA-carboxylase] ligase